MSLGADGRWRHHAALAVVSAAALAASGLPAPTLRDLRLSFAGGEIEIGAVHTDAGWLGVALAQAADHTLENVTIAAGGITYRLPRIVFSGASLSPGELRSLFDPAASEPLGPKLSRLSAREVTVPEIRIEQELGGAKQVTVYRDVVARDIASGRMASVTSAGATLDGKGGAAKGKTGQLVIRDVDLAYAASLYGQKAGAQPAEARRVYASVSLDDLEMSDAEGSEVRIARLAGRDFRARPTSESWSEAMRIMGEAQNLEKATPSERSRVAGVLVDLFDSFEIGSVEATGMEVRDRKAKDQTVSRIARIAFTGAGANGLADARIEGLDVLSGSGTVRIGTIAFTGFSFRGTLQGLKDLAEKPVEKADAADLRKLVPTIGTMRFSGLDFDVPNEASKAAKPENIRFGVRDIEVTADKPVNGVPTNLRMAVENVSFAVPANSEEEALKDLAALGYGKLDLSLVTAAAWNEPGNELVVREVSVRGAGMGSAVLRGVLANVGRDVFSPDSAVAAVALMGATARNLHVTIENTGLFERLIAQEARKQKKSPEDLRREYGVAAAIGIPAMLGNSSSAKAVGQAVARFVAKPGRLTISATTKDPAGLGIADFAATPEPEALLAKVDITATAE